MTNILFLHAGAEMYGSDRVLLNLITNLDKQRFQPYVILPGYGPLFDALKKNEIGVEIVPYPILRRRLFNPIGILNYTYGFIKYSRIIATIAKEKGIDIVHTNTAATWEGCYVSKKLGIPQLWSIHEIIEKPRLVYKVTSRVIAKYASITIAVSQAVKDHLIKSGYFRDEDIRVIYNGIDHKKYKPDNDCGYLYSEWMIPQESRIIGMIGRVNRWKGQKDFLEVANIVMNEYTDVYAIMVGSPFEGEEWREIEIKRAISQSAHKDRIVYAGYRIDNEFIHCLFDIFVLPSTDPDPLPTVVLEAMASEKPIVSYAHGGVCEMVIDNENGILTEVRNPKKLADAVKILLDDESKRIGMGKNSRRRIKENYSMEVYVTNYINQYESLCN